jgi:hypothetical protein
MFSINQDIRKSMARFGLLEQIEATQVCRYCQDFILNICNQSRNSFDIPRVTKYLKNSQTIEIELKNIIIGQKIRSNSSQILKEINAKMGGCYVEKIRYKMG